MRKKLWLKTEPRENKLVSQSNPKNKGNNSYKLNNKGEDRPKINPFGLTLRLFYFSLVLSILYVRHIKQC
jgi:hypothetical protein